VEQQPAQYYALIMSTFKMIRKTRFELRADHVDADVWQRRSIFINDLQLDT
jgi:hypothetical protein